MTERMQDRLMPNGDGASDFGRATAPEFVANGDRRVGSPVERARRKGAVDDAEPCVTVSLLFGASVEETLAGFTTVWMHGEHSLATAGNLSVAIRRASDLDEADVMVDFSDVRSIDLDSIDVIVTATAALHQKSLSLTCRRPSPCTRQLVDASGFAWLFPDEPHSRSLGSPDIVDPWAPGPRAPR